MTGCHIEQKNQPGHWKIGQNTPQAMGKDVLGTFMPHPGAIPRTLKGVVILWINSHFLVPHIVCFGCFLTPKTPIFGPTWTWNGTWMVHKSAQQIFPHCLGCVLTHFAVSRCVIGLIWQPSIMVYFNPKKGHFWTPPDLEWDQERR